MASFRAVEVLSMDGPYPFIYRGPVIVGTPDDGTLLEALRLADSNRESHLSARRWRTTGKAEGTPTRRVMRRLPVPTRGQQSTPSEKIQNAPQ